MIKSRIADLFLGDAMSDRYELNAVIKDFPELNIECHIERARQMRAAVVAGMVKDAVDRLRHPFAQTKSVAAKAPIILGSARSIGKPCY